MADYLQLGQKAFLELHGFGRASAYVVRDPLSGQWADSKAIAGVAVGKQFPAEGVLRAAQFSGGIATVVPGLESSPAYLRTPVKRDYFAREAQNRSLGHAGEVFALAFERWRLVQLGVGQLADQVKHAALDEGDGLGYDIRSFDLDGQPRFIEVKTTAFGERTPFFVSANEARFARDHGDRFHLYRLFEFRTAPRLF